MFSVNKNYFEFLHIIGRGGFGKVWKVKLKKTNEFFALKEMSKTKIIDRRSETSIMSERTLLSKLNNPFIVNMYFAFQDYSNLYLVMDLLSGGDLRYQLAKKKKFSEKETKFFISNIILALEYIHSKNIIHRDIKPENLVLELNGYLRITDFGVAKINEKDNSRETSGTPGYMAPEVILVQNHSFPSDFFALGVIGYEFMLGYRPYLGRSRKEIKELIIYKQARLNEGEIPHTWSLESADFINKLLKRKPNKRLGYNGIKELKSHVWMRDINWNALKRKELVAPFIPYSNRENYDKNYCEKIEDIGRATQARYKEYTESELFKDAFKGYTYIDITYVKTKYKKHKNKETKENKENREEKEDKEENHKNNVDNSIRDIKNLLYKDENKKHLIINTPTSRMKKNSSMIIEDRKPMFKNDKILNISNSQKNFNFAINLYKIKKDSRNSKKNVGENDNNKDVFKRLTMDANLKSTKNKENYANKSTNIKNNKEKNKKIKYEKEKMRNRALRISEKIEKMNEMIKNQTNYVSNNNKKEIKKGMNKSNSMKMLNINIGVNLNYNLEKNKNIRNKEETKKINNIKTLNKKNSISNNNYNSKKPEEIRSSYRKIFSPRYMPKKINKSNSVILNHHKNEEKQKKEINKNFKNEINEKNIKQSNESSKKNINYNSEIKIINNENKNLNNLNNNLISNDFNIKSFEKDNYNEPRSKVMLWIQRSHPINQYENKNNKFNSDEKNEKINKENNDKINININNKKKETINNQKPETNLVNNKNKMINNKKLEINKLVRTSKNSSKNKSRATSQKKELNSSNRTKNYKSLIMNTNVKYKQKKVNTTKRQFKSSGNSKRNFFPKNKSSSQSVLIEKPTSLPKAIKSKTPKNTFLVFNTININLGNGQKGQKNLKTPKAQVIRNINSTLKSAYLRNDFIFESMPYFAKNEKDKLNNNNNNQAFNNDKDKKYINFMKNYTNKKNNNDEII